MIELDSLLIRFVLLDDKLPLEVIEKYIEDSEAGVRLGEVDSMASRNGVIARLVSEIDRHSDFHDVLLPLLAARSLFKTAEQLKKSHQLIVELEKIRQAAPMTMMAARMNLQRFAALLARVDEAT